MIDHLPPTLTRVDPATKRSAKYIRADVAAAQLAERDAKLQAIRDVVHRWIDSEQGSSPDSMLKVLEILYPPRTKGNGGNE